VAKSPPPSDTARRTLLERQPIGASPARPAPLPERVPPAPAAGLEGVTPRLPGPVAGRGGARAGVVPMAAPGVTEPLPAADAFRAAVSRGAARTVADRSPRPAEDGDATIRDLRAVLEVPSADVEAAFFAAAGPGEEDVRPGETEVPAPGTAASAGSRLPLILGVVVAVAVLAFAFQVLARRDETPAPPPAAAPAPVVAKPASPGPVPEPEPEVVETPVDVTENLKLAQGFYESGQYPRATSVLEQVVQDAPRSVDAWLLLGLVRYDARDTLGARSAAGHVLAIDPRNARVQILLASIYFEAKEADAAKAALNRYLELEPAGPFADEAQKLLKR
jgi:hypothetical protein